MSDKKNQTLELLKLFASYMVVFIHVLFYGKFGMIMDALARFAVPLFFLISGFYSYHIKPETIMRRVRKTFVLFVIATICYTIFNISMLLLKGGLNDVLAYFSDYLNPKVLIKLFLFNVPISSVHLWYLLAMVYVYIVFYFATVFHLSEKVVFGISFFLLFLHIMLGECLSAFGIVLPISILRNFALMGIPFFALGLFIRKYEHKLNSVPNYAIVIAAIIGVVETIFSRCYFGKNELYIGSLFILFAIVSVFIKYSNVKYPAFFMTLAGCSTFIYIFHFMVKSVIDEMYNLINIDFHSSIILVNMKPILVCIVSTIFALVITYVLRVFSKKPERGLRINFHMKKKQSE